MTTLGRYQITSTLGEGAMGVVYRAHDPSLDREVALKELRLPEGLSGKARQAAVDRFYTEARAAARLSHPSIVTVHEVGEDDGRPFIAMELLDGPTLGEVLAEVGALPPDQAEEVLLQIAEALAHAHAQGVVHRDIKPDNCFWLADGRVKVADFGIARVEEGTRLTQVGTVMGTPGYMAPEQVRGEEVGPSADVFAWGALAYECLTGRPPFGEGDAQAVLYRIVHEDPPDLSKLAPGIPPHLLAVVGRALAKEPGERWGDGGLLVQGLSSPAVAMHSRAPRRNRVSRSREGSRVTRRPLVLVGIGVGLAMVAAVVTAFLVWGGSGEEGIRVGGSVGRSPTEPDASGDTISSNTETEEEPLTLSLEGIGTVRLDETPWETAEPVLAPLLGRYSAPEPVETCGDPAPRVDFVEGSNGLTLVVVERGGELVIEGIILTQDVIPTDRGIRVGSTVTEVRRAYPGVVFSIEQIASTGYTEGPEDLGAFTTTPRSWWLGLRGSVDDAGFMNNPLVSDSARVTELRIGNTWDLGC